MSKSVVHIKVGGDMGDHQAPFIPGSKELEVERKRWQEFLGDEYLVIASHHLVQLDIYD